jgi:nicotinate-nucleotide pyrophosphorylase
VPVAHITGPACRLLQGERVALNLMARASGIASRARQAKNLASEAGTTVCMTTLTPRMARKGCWN